MVDTRRAQEILDLAWEDLPPAHRALLEAIGASQRKAVELSLGSEITDLRRSAGLPEMGAADKTRLDDSLGAWVTELRVVLVHVAHEKYEGLNEESYEAALAWVAWHEWGHALSVDRATDEDIANGRHLLSLAPEPIAEIIRGGDYRSIEWTHELIADIFATLMARRRRGQTGKPQWLNDEIWNLIIRVTGWTA